ncbi:Cystatin-related plant [Arabidopsis suecica]|uniref:Cystatin-related plant n=1 Tax=Arabidopsis suecica TaxID=45249 RepID=A0A8T2HCT9_ARASU|nr:Cystatin-related plant [Arabidopsis suecica]
MSEFEGWIKWLEPGYLLWKPEDPGYERPAYRDWTEEEDEPKYSPEQELALLDKQILASDGFDIDFTHFRCVFNYHLAYLDSHEFVDEPETTRDLLERLSRKAHDDYNQESRTQFEFVKVVKANFHFCCAIMFLITFEVVDPYDNLIKLFQTRVRHAEDIVTEYVFCRPKPNQGVECIGVKNNDGKDVQTNVKEQEIGVGASICHKE